MKNTNIVLKRIKNIASNELMYMFSDILIKAIAFLTLPFFVNLMSTAEFGQFSLYQTYIGIFSIFFGFNIQQGIVRYYIDKGDKEKYLTTAIWINLASGIIFSTIIILIESKFQIFGLSNKAMYVISLGAIFNGVMHIGLESIRASLKAYLYATFSILSSLISTILGLFLVYFMSSDLGYWRLVSIVVSYVVVGIILTYGIVRKDGITFKKDTAKYLLSYSIPLIPYTLSTTVISQINRLFLANIGLSEVGIYSFAANLATIIYIISISLNRAFQPFLFVALRDNKDFKKRMYQNMGLFYVMYVGFIFLNHILIKIFGNAQYYSAIKVIPILTIGYGFHFVYSIYANFLYYLKRNIVLSFLAVLSAIITVILNMILIPIFGYMGAAFSMVGSYFMLLILAYIYIRRKTTVILFTIRELLTLIFMLIIPVIIKLFLGGII